MGCLHTLRGRPASEIRPRVPSVERGGMDALPHCVAGAARTDRRVVLDSCYGSPMAAPRGCVRSEYCLGERAAGLSGLGSTPHHLRPPSSTNAGVGGTHTLLVGAGSVVRLAWLGFAPPRNHHGGGTKNESTARGRASVSDPRERDRSIVRLPLLAVTMGDATAPPNPLLPPFS